MGSEVKQLDGFVKRTDVIEVDPEKIVLVGVDEELTDENWFAFCPRADEPVDDEFIEDVKQNGVRTPLEGYRDGSRVVLLDGRRRLKAARIAGLVSVKVILRKDDPEGLFAVNISAEATRKSLLPTQRAKLMQHFINTTGASQKACAKLFAVSPRVVQYTVALLDLAPHVQSAVDEGVISAQRALDLIDVPRDEQKLVLEEMISQGATKGAAAHAAAEAAKKGEKIDSKEDRGAKLLPRKFLERFLMEVREADPRLAAWLRFILGGGQPPKNEDDEIKGALDRAGWREMKKARGKKKVEAAAAEAE